MTIDIPATWSRAHKRWESHGGRYYFDRDEAERTCDFFPTFLAHYIGEFAGQSFTLFDYQRLLVVLPAFGWKSAATGARRFRFILLFVPKGNGKSPIGSGLGLFLAGCDGEAAAEVYAIAGDKDQAKVVHDSSKVMVEESADLAGLCDVTRDSIYFRDSRSSLKVISADAPGKHGRRPHGVIIDELHNQRNRDLYEAMRKSMAKRRQPMMILLSHAGDDDESICVVPETRLLTSDLRWVAAGEVEVGHVLAGFDEHRGGTEHRLWRKAVVTAKSVATLPSYELELDDGTRVTCSEDHMWLIQTAGRRVEWRRTKDIQLTDSFFKTVDVWERDESWGAGYLAWLLDGEGHLSKTERAHMLCGFTQRENEVSALGRKLLEERGLRTGIYETTHGSNQSRVFQTMVTRKRDVMRLLGSVRPARLLPKFEEFAFDAIRFKAFAHPRLTRKAFVGSREVVGLKTSTHTYVAEGLASHNCYEEYEYAKSVIADPTFDESYLPVIFEAAKDEDWTQPAIWKKANPAFGVTINPEIFAGECRAAQNEPRKKNDFLRYNLNRWVNQATAWIPVEWWDACPASLPPDSELRNLEVCGGLDMSQKIDLASFVLTFKEPLQVADELEVLATDAFGNVAKKQVSLNYRVHVLPMFWIPENTMKEHEHNDKVPYSLWADKGWVTFTEGDIIDDDRIYRDIVKMTERFPKLKEGEIAYDPAFATSLALRLQAAGFKVVEVPQNYRQLSEPSQVFEALLKGRRITHDGNRCLRWNVENVSIKTDDARRIRPVKPKKAVKRVDGVVASIMGISRLMVLKAAPEMQLMFV